MNGKLRARVTPLMISAMRRACSSLSITQGPAMRKRSPEPMRTLSIWKERDKRIHRRDAESAEKITTESLRRKLHIPSCTTREVCTTRCLHFWTSTRSSPTSSPRHSPKTTRPRPCPRTLPPIQVALCVVLTPRGARRPFDYRRTPRHCIRPSKTLSNVSSEPIALLGALCVSAVEIISLPPSAGARTFPPRPLPCDLCVSARVHTPRR